MEVIKPNSNSLNNYIRIYDNVVPEQVLETFTKICKERLTYEDGSVVGTDNPVVDKKIRNTKIWDLKNIDEESLTSVHWCNFYGSIFENYFRRYFNELNVNDPFRLLTIQVLKYNVGGHYKFHVDHGLSTPRTLSSIFLVNDDYEGGDLMFQTTSADKNLTIKKIKNRLIVWPSNFLFPHSVQPVSSGERYSIVSWAL